MHGSAKSTRTLQALPTRWALLGLAMGLFFIALRHSVRSHCVLTAMSKAGKNKYKKRHWRRFFCRKKQEHEEPLLFCFFCPFRPGV
jgi:hypothetical protein